MPTTEIPLCTSYPSVKLFKSSVASEGFEQMADSTIYGTPGKMRYAHVKSVEKIKTLKNTAFLEFKRNDLTLGIVALVGHQLNVAKQRVSGLYVRYFSLNTPMRSDRQRAKKEGEKRGALHHMIKELFDHPEKLNIDSLDEKSIIYAFVESQNERSLNMVKSMGFLPSRQLVTLLFSRFYPKQKLAISELSEGKYSEMNALLRSFYKNYNLVPDFNEQWDRNFIHEVGGQIVFGAMLETNTWRIYEMPGFDGWLFRKVLPRIPILNRIFQKDKIDFIGIERLYIRPGFEHLLPSFLETLCAQFGMNKAMIGVDNKSPLHELLKTKGKLGLLDKLINPSPGLLFSRTYGISNKERQSLTDFPFYVSTYDMS